MSSSAPMPLSDSDDVHSGPFVARVNGYSIVDCAACGFRHVIPLPAPDALIETYTQDYYTKTKPSYLRHAKEDESWASLAYGDRLETIASLLAPGQRSLIDVGSGPGSFLAHAQTKGWTVRGIEPSQQACEHARERGLHILEGFLSAATAQALGTADAVHLMNVLEHVPNPEQILRLAASLLKENGAICVGVPNDYNPLQRVVSTRGAPSWWLAPPHHLNYFDFDSLEALIERIGLKPRVRLTSFPMELFLTFGCNYIGDDALGRACHSERCRFDVDLEVAAPGKRLALYRALAQAGFGREAIIFATKP